MRDAAIVLGRRPRHNPHPWPHLGAAVFGYTPPAFIFLDAAFARHGSRLRAAAVALKEELARRPTWIVPLVPHGASATDLLALQDDPAFRPEPAPRARLLATVLQAHLRAAGVPLPVHDAPPLAAASIPSALLALEAHDAVTAAQDAGVTRLLLWSHPEREGRLPKAAAEAAQAAGITVEERELRLAPSALL